MPLTQKLGDVEFSGVISMSTDTTFSRLFAIFNPDDPAAELPETAGFHFGLN